MGYDKKLIAAKLKKWEGFLREYNLPTWENLPALDLYMDQIIILLGQYLNFLPPENDGQQLITPSIINNYVRMKVMPSPVKKRYGRVHLAYLIMICTLKRSLNISLVQKMLPLDLCEDQVRDIYNEFVALHKKTSLGFIDQIIAVASPAMDPAHENDQVVTSLIMTAALQSNVAKLLAEKLLCLPGQLEN